MYTQVLPLEQKKITALLLPEKEGGGWVVRACARHGWYGGWGSFVLPIIERKEFMRQLLVSYSNLKSNCWFVQFRVFRLLNTATQ